MGTLTGYSKAFRYDQSGRLIYEGRSNQYYGELGDSESILYLYDETGIIGMVLEGSAAAGTYYFQRNLLGDVIGIYNTSGTKVGGYAYDAWGNCTITLNTNGIAAKNPIRYRGYYYDEDTKLYFLNARYYSPEWRRFISPDDTAYLDPESVNGLNLYAYCYNDPVNYKDPSGRFPITALLISIGIGALFGGVAAGISSLSDGNTGWALVGDILGGALIGGATGAAFTLGGLVGAGMIGVKAAITSFAVSTTASFAAGVGANVLQSTFRGEAIDWNEALQDGAFTAIQSAISFWVGASMSYGGMWNSLNNKTYSYTALVKAYRYIGLTKANSCINGALLYLELFGKDMIIRSSVKFLYTYFWSYLRNNN